VELVAETALIIPNILRVQLSFRVRRSMNIIETQELKQLIESKEAYVLIDIRYEPELSYGMIPTAHHIPLPEIGEALQLSSSAFTKKYGFSVDKKVKLIFYCRTGSRSQQATQIALQLGYNASNYKGSIKEWSKHDPHVQMYS